MWYRLYLAKMPKDEFEAMKKMTFDEFYEKYWDWEFAWEKDLKWIYDFTEQIYELGKYVDYSEGMERVVFADEKLQNRYWEYSFHELQKDVLKNIIEDYSQKVAEYYKSLVTWIEFPWFMIEDKKIKRKNQMQRIFRHLQQKSFDFGEKKIWKKTRHWSKICFWRKPYNIDGGAITNSWEYEYAIFELIRIYREFDEEKYALLYYWY